MGLENSGGGISSENKVPEGIKVLKSIDKKINEIRCELNLREPTEEEIEKRQKRINRIRELLGLEPVNFQEERGSDLEAEESIEEISEVFNVSELEKQADELIKKHQEGGLTPEEKEKLKFIMSKLIPGVNKHSNKERQAFKKIRRQRRKRP